MPTKERVNHATHYNCHPNGIECIDIIRYYTFDIACAMKYLWRAGLKGEEGMSDLDKEAEDLRKGQWYVNDYIASGMHANSLHNRARMSDIVLEVTGHSIAEITSAFTPAIAAAMSCLLCVGIIYRGRVCQSSFYERDLREAVKHIDERLSFISPF